MSELLHMKCQFLSSVIEVLDPVLAGLIELFKSNSLNHDNMSFQHTYYLEQSVNSSITLTQDINFQLSQKDILSTSPFYNKHYLKHSKSTKHALRKMFFLTLSISHSVLFFIINSNIMRYIKNATYVRYLIIPLYQRKDKLSIPSLNRNLKLNFNNRKIFMYNALCWTLSHLTISL